jgi:hypothetical protein
MIPLYTYPGSTWGEVFALAKANPKIPVMTIINPDSGPGTKMDANYLAGVLKLRAAGVGVLGYVSTSYASRDLSAVRSCVRAYKNWYPVNGIFFDEMSNIPGRERYYSVLDGYAKSLGFSHTMGNPGVDVPPSYIGTLDTFVIHESEGLPSASLLRGWHSDFAKSNFAAIAYGMQDLDEPSLAAASPYLGYVYVTNAGLPNPYASLPPYLASIAGALENATKLYKRRLAENALERSAVTEGAAAL